METCIWFWYGIFPNPPVPIHTMKCIGLFKGLHSSTCVINMLNSSTQFLLKMLSDSILYCSSNFKIFHFQHYYSNMHIFSVVQMWEGCIMYLVVCTYSNFSISKMLQRTIPITVYKISTGRKYYEFYVEMSPNCSILASIFQNFPGGHAPRPP